LITGEKEAMTALSMLGRTFRQGQQGRNPAPGDRHEIVHPVPLNQMEQYLDLVILGQDIAALIVLLRPASIRQVEEKDVDLSFRYRTVWLKELVVANAPLTRMSVLAASSFL